MFDNIPAIVPWPFQGTSGKTLIGFKGGCPDLFAKKERAAVEDLLKKHGLNETLVIVDDEDSRGYLLLLDEHTDGRLFDCELNTDDESILLAYNSLVPGVFVYDLLRLITAAANPEDPDTLEKLISVVRNTHVIWCDDEDDDFVPFTWADVELLLAS
ncbi:hypothetical protein IV500_04775 [Paeniglutamicibacter antarcticus]|uniref:Uncharacterized protein n=1 Tax=Arthrobacter terrae TaxID=2935737 RepID=A0A931G9I6_9MICC|nr:hypothetical protein [Arthrobacter terrae]MBG0738732.1 hypothetical protein [Arthrobacter terrae]